MFADDVWVESAIMLCVNRYSSGVIDALIEFNTVQPGICVCCKACIKGCVYEKDCYTGHLGGPHDACQISAIGKLLIFLSSANIYYLVEAATPEYLPDKNVYYVCSVDPRAHVFQQSNLWHIGALHGYSYTDGFLLSLKATMPL